MLVHLEPIWQYAEEEEEDGKTKKHDPRHDADRVPHLTCLRRDKTVLGQAEVKGVSGYCDTFKRCAYIFLAWSPRLIKANAVNPGGPTVTNAPFAWWPSMKPVVMILRIEDEQMKNKSRRGPLT